jgi:Flp pilus assembly protein TadD
LALLASACLSVRSYLRSTDWATPEGFYRRTLAAGGTSARTGLNLGQIYANRGEYAEAEKIFRKVLEIAPDYPIAQNNLASVLSQQGKKKEAEALFSLIEKNSVKTRTEFPCTWMGAINIARMRHNAHDDNSALVILERAQNYYPEVWELIRLKSEILRETKGPDAALRIVEDFARTNWWHHGAALAVGRLYAQRGDAGLADAALRRASSLDVHDTEALQLMVWMRLRQNRFDEAFQLQRRAVARQPDQPSQYVLLSNILDKMGRQSEARAVLAQASGLRALVQNQSAAN